MDTTWVTESARSIMQALGTGQISAVELVGLYLEQIKRLNPSLNAVVILNDEEALASAQAADQARADGDPRPLLGLLFTVKDCVPPLLVVYN